MKISSYIVFIDTLYFKIPVRLLRWLIAFIDWFTIAAGHVNVAWYSGVRASKQIIQLRSLKESGHTPYPLEWYIMHCIYGCTTSIYGSHKWLGILSKNGEELPIFTLWKVDEKWLGIWSEMWTMFSLFRLQGILFHFFSWLES